MKKVGGGSANIRRHRTKFGRSGDWRTEFVLPLCCIIFGNPRNSFRSPLLSGTCHLKLIFLLCWYLLKEIYKQRAGWVTSTCVAPVPCAVAISRLVENETGCSDTTYVTLRAEALISQSSNELNFRLSYPKFINLCCKSFVAKIPFGY